MSELMLDLSNVAAACLLAATLLGLFKLKHATTAVKWLVLQLVVAMVVEVLSRVFWAYQWNNMPLLHAFTLVEFTLFALFFDRAMLQQSRFKLVGRMVCWAVGGGILCNSLFVQSWFEFNSYGRLLESAVLIGAGVIFLFWSAHTGVSIAKGLHWMVGGTLIYFSGIVFIFLFSNLQVHFKLELRMELWAIHALINALFYGLIFIGLWKHPSIKMKSSSSSSSVVR